MAAALVGLIGLSAFVTPTSWWENGGRCYFAAVYGLVVILPLLLFFCWKVREDLPAVKAASSVAEFPRKTAFVFAVADPDQSGIEPGQVRLSDWQADVQEVSSGRYLSPLWPDDQGPKVRSDIIKELRRGLRKFCQKSKEPLTEATERLICEEELRKIGQRVEVDSKAESNATNAAGKRAAEIIKEEVR
jgi:hypothetical protein